MEELCAAMYAPNTVHAKVVKGTPVTIREETHYPFSEEITFHIDPAKPTQFKLKLRIPAWCSTVGWYVTHASGVEAKK